MQTTPEPDLLTSRQLERTANVLRLTEWLLFWVQLGLAIASGIMLVFAASGRNFSQAVTTPVPGAVRTWQGTTPGLGIGIFWAVCGIIALFVSLYFAFRLTRLARRLRHPNPTVHPRRADVVRLLRLGTIVSLVGLLLAIIGGGATLSVLLVKSIAVPQGVAVYNPTRLIRPLDIFVAMANMNAIAAHFVGMATSLGLYRWLHRSD